MSITSCGVFFENTYASRILFLSIWEGSDGYHYGTEEMEAGVWSDNTPHLIANGVVKSGVLYAEEATE